VAAKNDRASDARLFLSLSVLCLAAQGACSSIDPPRGPGSTDGGRTGPDASGDGGPGGRVRAQIGDSSAFAMTLAKPDGTAVIALSEMGLDLWRQGEYIRGKWGIYRGKSPALRTVEETVLFANFAITAGATPSTDGR
jgi:hypothetical protein